MADSGRSPHALPQRRDAMANGAPIVGSGAAVHALATRGRPRG